MLFSTSSKASVCRLASLAPLPVLSRVLLNEDYFNSHLEHTQASTCLPAAERFTCFTMSQSAQYGEKKMIVLIAARSGQCLAGIPAKTPLMPRIGGLTASTHASLPRHGGADHANSEQFEGALTKFPSTLLGEPSDASLAV